MKVCVTCLLISILPIEKYEMIKHKYPIGMYVFHSKENHSLALELLSWTRSEPLLCHL